MASIHYMTESQKFRYSLSDTKTLLRSHKAVAKELYFFTVKQVWRYAWGLNTKLVTYKLVSSL